MRPADANPPYANPLKRALLAAAVVFFLSSGRGLWRNVITKPIRYWLIMPSHKLELATAHDIWPNKAVIPANVPQCDDFLRS